MPLSQDKPMDEQNLLTLQSAMGSVSKGKFNLSEIAD
jgi:hypothetical protein